MDALHGTSLKKQHVIVLVGPVLALFCLYLSASLLVQFISKTQKWERLCVRGSSIVDKSLLPFVEVLKAFTIGQVVAKNAAVRTSVERISQRLKLLLAGRVPDLQGDHRVVY